jgi:hypothetical protein
LWEWPVRSLCRRALAGLARFRLALALVGRRLAEAGLIEHDVPHQWERGSVRTALRLVRDPVGELPIVWALCEILGWPPGPVYEYVR